MSLNIKNEEAHKLALKLSRLTGESMAAAVTIALKERLDRLQQSNKKSNRKERMQQLRKDCGERLKNNKLDHAALLYGEDGMPI
ncbi:MAG: type II toxin-antitoxin system VapB family antitoxin [Cyanobacteria bacterium]|nr:type II toxin-antitoxin system VapB family antitoxin [Cyanobacteriota bacterium]